MRPAVRFDKASLCAFVPQERPTVYRLYGRDGAGEPVLVYAGASMAPRARLLAHLREHQAAKSLLELLEADHGRFASVDTVELEFFRNTTAMAKAERRAIAEGPLMDSGPARRHHAWRTRG